MTTSEISIPRLSDAEHRVQLRRAAISEAKQPRSGRLRLQRHDTDQFQLTMRMSFVTVTTPRCAIAALGS